jgi:hypothetical protein
MGGIQPDEPFCICLAGELVQFSLFNGFKIALADPGYPGDIVEALTATEPSTLQPVPQGTGFTDFIYPSDHHTSPCRKHKPI